MKPDGGEMEDIDIEPSELFTQLGMLVVESRLPEATAKGRRQGPHCPLGVGDVGLHTCDSTALQCQRARTMQKQMFTLWRNRVPMCIEVMLLPECSHGQERGYSSDVSLPLDKGGSLLLEQWTVQVLPKRAPDSQVSARLLFQAIQSYLYFSQLGAWLNLSHGKFPSNVCYRISPPGDFCTTQFSQTPEWHTFPVSAVSKSLSIKVNVGGLPRMHEIPHIRCRESHGWTDQSSGSTDITQDCGMSQGAKSTFSSHQQDRTRDRNSPRFQKPRVVSEPLPDTSKKLDVAQCAVRTSEADLSKKFPDTRGAKSPQGLMSHLPCSAKHTGAIPKRLSQKSPPPTCYYESDYASSAPELESLAKEDNQHAGSSRSCSNATSPKVIVTHKSQSPVYYSKDKVNWILQNVVNKDSSTDSDSSSPDIDRYLNKTLASRLDPLSPAEMENYLGSLVHTAPSKTKKEYDSKNINKGQKSICELRRMEIEPNSVKSNLSKQQKNTPLGRNAQEICMSFQNLLRQKDFISEHETRNPQQDHDIYLPKQTNKLSRKNSVKTSNNFHLPPEELGAVKFSIDDDVDTELQASQYSDCYSNGAGAVTFSNGASAVINGAGRMSPDPHNHYIEPLPQCELEQTENITVDQNTFSDLDLSTDIDNGTNLESSHTSHSKLPFHKSISCPGSEKGFSVAPSLTQQNSNTPNTLLKSVMRREMAGTEQNKENLPEKKAVPIPTNFDQMMFQKSLNSSANMIFHAATGLPMQSSPAPTKKRASDSFDYDGSLSNPRAIKNSISCVNLDKQKGDENTSDNGRNQRLYSTSAPASTNCLLGNFEESMLNGRLEPSGVVEGFTSDIGASGTFCPKHVTLPMTAFFFRLSDDNAPSPYLGHINIEAYGKRGYHVPKKGTVQVTIFNPNKTVVKMFVVVYDLDDMPANCQTFLRQRTLYMPVSGSPCDTPGAPVYLRYLIHLRFSSSKSGKIYLHTDIRLIFARDKFEFDSRVANYELRSFTEGPVNPKFSPKR